MIAMLRSILFLCLWIGPANAASAQLAWYTRGHGHPPTAHKVYICHGYTCRIVSLVYFNDDDINRIAASLAAGTANAAAERQAVSRADQVFEQIVGERVGTAHDLPGMQFGRAADGQMDCIDEATNTTTLLLFLAEHGFLKYHTVQPPAGRGFFLDLRYPHATAVLLDTSTGEKWAIDSWPRANAEPPVIQPLSVWKRGRHGDPLS